MFCTTNSAFSEREKVATNMNKNAEIPQNDWTRNEMMSTSTMMIPHHGGF